MPYKDPIKRKEFKHKYYLQHKQEIVERTKKFKESHPGKKKLYDRNYNQKKNAPYHKILEEAGVQRVCEFCGATENIHTHHKDLNHSNNELNNLQWLCGSCHSKLHNELRKEEHAT